MKIEEIIANAFDLAGGSLIREKLGADLPTLLALNVIDTMMLELSNSGKQFKDYKLDLVLAAGSSGGTVATSAINLDEKYIRYREGENQSWRELKICTDIEELTGHANKGERAILFQGATSPLSYFLSFTPEAAITVELWAKSVTAEIANLNDAPPFPPEFSMLAAYRTAEFVLNQLLLIDAKNYAPFVSAQKQSMRNEQVRCEHVWSIYRTSPPDARSAKSRQQEWDMFAEIQSGEQDDNYPVYRG